MMRKYSILLFVILLTLVGCSKQEEAIQPAQPTPQPTPKLFVANTSDVKEDNPDTYTVSFQGKDIEIVQYVYDESTAETSSDRVVSIGDGSNSAGHKTDGNLSNETIKSSRYPYRVKEFIETGGFGINPTSEFTTGVVGTVTLSVNGPNDTWICIRELDPDLGNLDYWHTWLYSTSYWQSEHQRHLYDAMIPISATNELGVGTSVNLNNIYDGYFDMSIKDTNNDSVLATSYVNLLSKNGFETESKELAQYVDSHASSLIDYSRLKHNLLYLNESMPAEAEYIVNNSEFTSAEQLDSFIAEYDLISVDFYGYATGNVTNNDLEMNLRNYICNIYVDHGDIVNLVQPTIHTSDYKIESDKLYSWVIDDKTGCQLLVDDKITSKFGEGWFMSYYDFSLGLCRSTTVYKTKDNRYFSLVAKGKDYKGMYDIIKACADKCIYVYK